MSRLFAQKFIIIVLSISLIISASMVCAFADDEVDVDDSTSTSVVYTELPDSMLPITVTDQEAIEADLQLRQTALDIANIMASASDSGTRAIDYPAYIYSILNACYDSGNQRLWVNDYSLNNKITTTNSYLNDIVLDLESTTYGIIPKLASMIQTQNSMYNRLDEISDYTSQISAVGGVSDTLYNIYTFLVGMMQNTSDEGYLETITNTLSNIRSLDLAPIKTGLNTINSSISSTNTGITTLNTNLTNFYNRNHTDLAGLVTATNNVNTNISNLRTDVGNFKSQNHTDITSLQSDMNNINWTYEIAGTGVYNSSGDLITSASSQNSVIATYSNQYLSTSSNFLIKFTVPVANSGIGSVLSDSDITFGIFDPVNKTFQPYTNFRYSIFYLDVPYNGRSFDIYVMSNNAFTIGSGLYFGIKVDKSVYYYINQNNSYARFLNINSEDFYKVWSYIISKKQYLTTQHIDSDIHDMSDDLDILRRMYASDDELAAKENQQQFEGQVLNDFTGSGSASASLGDVSAVKGVSTGVKSGLDSGYGVSSSMTVFGDASFWGWFSQENYNSLNNLYSPSGTREQLRKSGDDLPYYNQNLNEIMSGGGAYND